MKLLMFLAKQFTFRPFEKMLPEAGDSSSEVQVSEAAVVFVHSELQDEADQRFLLHTIPIIASHSLHILQLTSGYM